MKARSLPRASVARRLLLVFLACWLLLAVYGLGPLERGEVAPGPWLRMLLGIPVAPLLAAVTSGSSPGVAVFLGCFGLTPWMLAALAIWRHDAPHWRQLCYVVFPLWWLGLALMGGTA